MDRSVRTRLDPLTSLCHVSVRHDNKKPGVYASEACFKLFSTYQGGDPG
jgi:hypothetical protein